MTVTLNGVLSFLHVSNFSNASDDEAIFFHSLFLHLEGRAKILTREANGKCDRAYRALASVMIAACEEVSYPHEAEVANAEASRQSQPANAGGED
jgi:hypothetical protein